MRSHGKTDEGMTFGKKSTYLELHILKEVNFNQKPKNERLIYVNKGYSKMKMFVSNT